MDKTPAFTREQLEEMWKRPRERKVNVTVAKLLEVCNKTEWRIAVSFSGGKDSAVLLDITSKVWAWSKDSHNNAPLVVVFANTGNEYSCMPAYVKEYCARCERQYGITIDLHIVRPSVWFGDVVANEGYPIGSKRTAKAIRKIRKWLKAAGLDFNRDVAPLLDNGIESAFALRKLATSETLNTATAVLCLTGYKKDNKFAPAWVLSKRWRPLITAPFNVSERCCDLLKKAPIHQIQNKLGLSPVIAEMAADGSQRLNAYLQTGCNAFSEGKAVSKPMGFWLEQDVLWYISRYEVPTAPIYGELVEEEGVFRFTGAERTGCKLCLFGAQMGEDGAARLERLSETEPQTIRWAVKPIEDGGLGYKTVIDYINQNCKCKIRIPEQKENQEITKGVNG